MSNNRIQGSRLLPGAVLLLLLHGPAAYGQTSPCPYIFDYRQDPYFDQIYGLVEVHNLQIGQVVHLNVDLSIGTSVPGNNVGSIALVKSREDTFLDIYNNEPAQYRVNFPFRNILPNLLEIRVNGQPVCYGEPAEGEVVTTINLEHTLATQVQMAQADYNDNAIQYQPVQQTPAPVVYTPQVQYQPQPPRQTQVPQITYQQPVQQPPQPQVPQITYQQPVQQPPQPQVPQITYQQPVRPVTSAPPIQYRPQPNPVTRAPPIQYRPQPKPVFQTAVAQTQRPPLDSSDECGKPIASFSRLSINGRLSPKGQFPWAVPIFAGQGPSKRPQYICGSTIISTYHLVTASHCMYSESRKRRAGELVTAPGMYNIENFHDPDMQVRYVAYFIIHPDYSTADDGKTENDIAVMVLKKAIVYNDLVRPICLWSGADNLEEVVGKTGYVSGWGITQDGASKRPSYVTAKVVSKDQCRRKLGRIFSRDNDMFCADGHGEVPCTGDSGSGFVLKQGSRFYIRGIVSIGQYDLSTLLCDPTKYVIYTDIAPYRFWLANVMNALFRKQ